MTGLQRFGSAPALPNLSFGSPVAVKNEPGQPSSSTILSFGGLPAASTLNFTLPSKGCRWSRRRGGAGRS